MKKNNGAKQRDELIVRKKLCDQFSGQEKNIITIFILRFVFYKLKTQI